MNSKKSLFDYIIVILALLGFIVLLINPSFFENSLTIILAVMILAFIFRIFQLIKAKHYGILLGFMSVGTIFMAYILINRLV